MKLSDAQKMANELIQFHNLGHWRFEFDNAKRRFGCCHFSTRTITLSRHLVALNDEKHVKDTILHEIAHALAGHRAGHGWLWKLKAKEVGCSSERCYGSDVITPPKNWLGVCPNGHATHRLRRPSSKTSCSRCCPYYNDEFLFQWTKIN